MAFSREPVPERTSEERARAAAERAARRAARAGRQAPTAGRPSSREQAFAAPREPSSADEAGLAVPAEPSSREQAMLAARSEESSRADFAGSAQPPRLDEADFAEAHDGQSNADFAPKWEPQPVGVAAHGAPATAPAPRAPRTLAARASIPSAARRSIAGGGRRPTGAGGRWRRRSAAMLAMAALGAALWAINATFQPFHGPGSGAVRVVIPPGAEASAIGERLQRAGVIDSGFFFGLNATLTLRRGDLRDGSYLLRKGMTNGQAIEALMQGPKARVVNTFAVSIPEGLSRREAAPVVRRQGIAGDYLEATSRPALVRQADRLGLPRARRSLEGFLFPATYTLTAGASADDLAQQQLDAFAERMTELDFRYAKRRKLTRYDVLIIASMVEREASLERERPLIAAVIYNRLKRGMPLGIDATIRYAENNWSRPLRVSELERDGPYNTRLRRGLPPTPIGNPGLASLRAAAHPASVRYLFYVRKPGKSGEHAFSSTDARFERDVRRYQAARKNR